MGGSPDPAQLSVVIVNFQSYEELRACLASLKKAGDPPVVVVDHASDAEAADAVSRAFPRVRFLRTSSNEGFAAGVNRGTRETSTPLLLLLNPDCVVRESIGRVVEWMRDHADVGVVGPRIYNTDGTVQPTARRFPDFTTAIAGRSSWLTRVKPGNPLSRRNLPGRTNGRDPLEVDWVSGACMIVRRSVFDAVDGMDEGFFLYWEDADFCRRIKRAGWRIMYVPEAAATHTGGSSSRHAADASLEAFHRSAFRLFWKHASVPSRLVAPLVFIALRLRLAFMRRLVRWRHQN